MLFLPFFTKNWAFFANYTKLHNQTSKYHQRWTSRSRFVPPRSRFTSTNRATSVSSALVLTKILAFSTKMASYGLLSLPSIRLLSNGRKPPTLRLSMAGGSTNMKRKSAISYLLKWCKWGTALSGTINLLFLSLGVGHLELSGVKTAELLKKNKKNKKKGQPNFLFKYFLTLTFFTFTFFKIEPFFYLFFYCI